MYDPEYTDPLLAVYEDLAKHKATTHFDEVLTLKNTLRDAFYSAHDDDAQIKPDSSLYRKRT